MENNLREYKVVGPPGTGKTTFLRKNVERAAAAYGAAKVVVTSLTRAAAGVVAGECKAMPKDNIGTLHSFAYRALPGVDIAEPHIAEFNDFCAAEGQPMMKISAATAEHQDKEPDDIVDAPLVTDAPGDKLLSEMGKCRARMMRPEVWPESVRAFAKLWNNWKRAAGYIDFSDMLEIALRDVAVCPGDPNAFFADESQDYPRLAFALARKWGERALRWIHVGDPDQCLYQWAGSDPRVFYESQLAADHMRVLAQSYRVPRQVHSLAVKWINETPGRKPIAYAPRDYEGSVRRLSANTFLPARAIEDCQRQLDAGKSCMFLASCAYMLNKVIAGLRESGIPYHNPYRYSRGDWNPLRIGGVSPAARLYAYIKVDGKRIGKPAGEPWNNRDVRIWAEWMRRGDYLVDGAKADIERAAKDQPEVVPNTLEVCNYFSWQHWNELIEGNPQWWIDGLDPKHIDKLAFPCKVLERHGAAALVTPPRVIVSTIHAAKGGEADVCYLFPDLSPNAYAEWMGGGEGREGVRRAFYVAMTRAREELVICQACGNASVRI